MVVVVGSWCLWGAALRPKHRPFSGRGSVSVFVNASHLGLLVTMVGVAAISGWVLTKSIEEENSGSAWTWGTVFGVTSLVAAWSFWRLV